MSVVDPNGGGPLLVPGGAAAPPEGTGLTSVTAGEWDTPSTLVARVAADAAAVNAALSAARTTTPSLASSSGWTGSSYGGGTAGAINTGATRLEFAVNANGSGSVVQRTISLAVDWSMQARVVSMSDTTTDVRLVFLAANGSPSSQIHVDGTGGFECKFINAGGATIVTRALTAALTGVRAAMTAGTLWLRLRQSGGVISYWYGIGSGTAEPTSWLLLTTYAPPGTGDGEPTPVTFNTQLARTASSGAATASVADISYRDLSL